MSPSSSNASNFISCNEYKKVQSIFGVMRDSNGNELLPKSAHVEGILEEQTFSFKLELEYINGSDEKLILSYSFPKSQRQEILSMRLSIGERETEAKILPQDNARESSRQDIRIIQETQEALYNVYLGKISQGEKVNLARKYAQRLTLDGDKLRLVLSFKNDESDRELLSESEPGEKHKNIMDFQSQECAFSLKIVIKGIMSRAKVSCPDWDLMFREAQGCKIFEVQRGSLPDKDLILLLSDLPDSIFSLRKNKTSKLRKNIYTGKAPPKLANDIFLIQAANCFISSLCPPNLFKYSCKVNLMKKRQLSVSCAIESEGKEETLKPVEICTHISIRYEFFYEKGEEFAQIYNYMRKDKKLIQVWELLEFISEDLSLEQLFAIFLFWILKKDPDAERHKLRPVRYELRYLDKLKIIEIIAFFEHWLRDIQE